MTIVLILATAGIVLVGAIVVLFEIKAAREKRNSRRWPSCRWPSLPEGTLSDPLTYWPQLTSSVELGPF
ncbi:hypothetical protein AXW67_17615 [Bradyrhizobium neotropicale]|uniref:Uncharacterized protein n=1 Tax=Bradyrhizobium neotropicale TaxID=1497615 RepID=A0A176Z1R6_9BRAD|nr:hypothetical protein AXW67_17615 [Bradyrhizobium neotropicale]